MSGGSKWSCSPAPTVRRTPMWILKTLLRLPGSVVIDLDGQAAGVLLRASACHRVAVSQS